MQLYIYILYTYKIYNTHIIYTYTYTYKYTIYNKYTLYYIICILLCRVYAVKFANLAILVSLVSVSIPKLY